jgi:hypothetical protein
LVATSGRVHLAAELDEAVVHDVLFGDAVAHDLDVEPVAEDLAKVCAAFFAPSRSRCFSSGCAHERRHAAREHDQPVVVLGQQIEVDPRLVVVALEEALRDQRDEVAVADQDRRQAA